MAGRIILGVANPSLDSNGNPVSGSTLTFYQNGTTTPQAIYSDLGLTTPLANPLTSDSAGLFPEIYAAYGVGYSVKWTRTGLSDVTINDVYADASAIALSTMPNWITGLEFSTAGSSGTFGISAGYAADATNVYLLGLLSAFTKTTSSWAPGTGNGALDTGSIANSTWYYIWLIQRSDTGVVDLLFSTSSTSPTMPTNYDRKRLINVANTDSSAHWVKRSQKGDNYLSSAVVSEYSGTPASSAVSLTLSSVPPAIQVLADLRGQFAYSAATDLLLISSLDVTDVAPSAGVLTAKVTVTAQVQGWAAPTRTNTSGQVRVRSFAADGLAAINCHGFTWNRGKS